MSQVDLHPEDLIDREVDELTQREVVHLEEHRQHCVACELERELRNDFAQELESTEEDDEVMARVLERVVPAHRGRSRRPALPIIRFAAAAAVLLLSAGAAAAMWTTVSGWIDGGDGDTTEAPETRSIRSIRSNERERDPVPTKRSPRRSRSEAAQESGPQSSEPTRAEPGIAESVSSTRSSAISSERAETAGSNAAAAPRPELASSNESARPMSVPSPAARNSDEERPDTTPARVPTAEQHRSVVHEPQTPAPTASELFTSARSARRAGRFAESSRYYRELATRYPGSREDVAARIIHGRMLLQRLGDPHGALRLFDRYLAASPGGNLAQEARLGRALCFGRLGRRSAEARAWRELLARHPDSVHSARARARLLELDRSSTPPE